MRVLRRTFSYGGPPTTNPDVDTPDSIVVFTLDDHRYALGLSAVERIVPVVEITALPRAPEIVLGVINVQGDIVPVMNVRRRFSLGEREIVLSDKLIIARTSHRRVVLLVDSVCGVRVVPREKMTGGKHILPEADYIEGAARLEEGLVLIHDLEKFLSLDEERTLQEAMTGG
jgi:purine-binding chemotaxis protein CheW